MSVMKLQTCEMHTGGEPLRIIESGFPDISGNTILEKRSFVKKNLDHLRKLLMWEPRGHFDMYGALLVPVSRPEADLAVIFMHNEGYSTMCGHACIALARYAVDKGLIKSMKSPETKVTIECPCGLVDCYTDLTSGHTHFVSVPAFVFQTDLDIHVDGYGKLKADISYGGAFYAILSADMAGLNVKKSGIRELVDFASAVTESVKKQVKLYHPESSDLAFLYGTILTDGKEEYSEKPTANICVFADRQVDRSPCGSGVTARVALQFHKGFISIGRTCLFESAKTGDIFSAKAVEEMSFGDFQAVKVEVGGKGWYTGSATFTLEDGDNLGKGFFL